MKLIWQLLSCLKILFVVLFFSGCEQKPLIIDTGDNGLKVDVITSFSFNTITEQRDSLNIGNSFKLYLGQIDSIRNSQILFRINPELLLQSNVCNDSTEVLNSFIKLRSTAQIYDPIGESENELTNSGLGREYYSDSTQFNAYFISELDSIYGWVDNSISISETIDISQFESIPLGISIDQFNLNIHLESLFNTDSSNDTIDICNFGNPVFILLSDGNESRFTEFFSSEFLGASVVPSVYSEIEYLQTIQTEINKFEITSIESNFLTENNIIAAVNEDGFYSGKFYNETPESIIDNPYLISMEDTAQNIELLKLNIELNGNVGDSSNSINLFFHSVDFSNQAINSTPNPDDPALDNWDEEDSTGTDGNNTYDFGEFYFDCGIDNLCDEDEPGYFPNGLENNNKWDDGEIYLDCGPDSLCNVDEVGYDPILNIDPAGDDYNPDPNNDNWSNSILIDSFYVYFEVVNIDSIECSIDYEGINYYSYLTEINSNLYLSDLWCGQSELYCSACDTLVYFSYMDSTLEYIQTGTENNSKWDFIDLNENGIFDYEDSYEEFLDLGFDNYPEQEGNEFSDPFENNGQWDFDDLNENGEYDLGEPHENFTDCGVDNICDIDEIGYNPDGTEGNSQYDSGEYYEDCGLDLVCGEIPDIDDLVLDPNEDNWNYLDSTGTEGNNLKDSLEIYYDWGIDQLPDSLELPYQATGGSLDYHVGTNSWEFFKEPFDTVFDKPDIGNNDLVLWISSIEGDGNLFAITISINSISDISYFEFGLGHVPYFEFSEELINENLSYTNYSVAPSENTNFINDISSYPKSNIEIDTSNFHINYSDNFITRIEIPELDEIIENNFNSTISKALIHFVIDSSNVNYFVNEAGIKISFSKFIDFNLDSFNSAKTLLSSQIIKDQTSVEIDFTTEMQKLLTGESTNNGFVFEASRESNNFSHLTFFNELDSLNKPKLEIMIIK